MKALQPKGFLLLDSGAQYLDGTTDITRTIALVELTEEEKTDYTLISVSYTHLDVYKRQASFAAASASGVQSTNTRTSLPVP